MEPSALTALLTFAGLVVTAIIAPMVVSRIKERESRDPTNGWRAAFEYMERNNAERDKKIGDLESKVDSLEEEVRKLENDNDLKTRTIARLETVVEEQSRAITARDHRIAQLEGAWPTDMTMPRPDPAFDYQRTRT